ncbi:MAG: hypothetical protein ACK559_25800, partial [bacterium]
VEACALPGLELACAEVVVARVAVGKAVGHGEVDDLVSPIGRGDVQLQASRLGAGGQGTRQGQRPCGPLQGRQPGTGPTGVQVPHGRRLNDCRAGKMSMPRNVVQLQRPSSQAAALLDF